MRDGPNPNFQEPGGTDLAEGFSTARVQEKYPSGDPETAAANKARLFADEGGPAILEIDVPEAFVKKADVGSEVRFEPGFGLEELLAAWDSLPKRIVLP